MVCFLTKGISCFWWTMSIVAILLIVDTYYTYTLSKKKTNAAIRDSRDAIYETPYKTKNLAECFLVL